MSVLNFIFNLFQNSGSDYLSDLCDKSLIRHIKKPLNNAQIKSIKILPPPREVKGLIPEKSGIYVSYDDKNGIDFLYVGASSNMKKRVTGNTRVSKRLPMVIVEIDEVHVWENEKSLIKFLRPSLNKRI